MHEIMAQWDIQYAFDRGLHMRDVYIFSVKPNSAMDVSGDKNTECVLNESDLKNAYIGFTDV